MSGSSPEAEVVTRSMGTGAFRVLGVGRGCVVLHAVDQLLVRRAEIGAAGVGGVIAVSRRRSARMKVAGAGEWLSHDPRADDSAVAHDELAVGLVGEEHLRDAGDDQRINDSQQNGRGDGHQDCGNKILFHRCASYANPMRLISMSISLIPMNGAMMPPKP